MIPVTFLTGFYVTEVVRRYWDQFMSLPFPDELALKLVTHVPGKVGYTYVSQTRVDTMPWVEILFEGVFLSVSTKVVNLGSDTFGNPI